jgi:hypothetical protein
MTTFTNFTPNQTSAFQFTPNLDGAAYTAIITWNVFGRRFYLNLYSLDGTLILCTALISSPTGISLGALTWANGLATGTTIAPHGYKIGSTVALTISGASPTAFNGLVNALITGPATFTYPIASNPGAATVFGTASYDINLIGGVPNQNGVPFSSTLVFRDASQQFETSP